MEEKETEFGKMQGIIKLENLVSEVEGKYFLGFFDIHWIWEQTHSLSFSQLNSIHCLHVYFQGMVMHICKPCCWEHGSVRKSDDIPYTLILFINRRRRDSATFLIWKSWPSEVCHQEEGGMEQKKSEKVVFMHSAKTCI